MRQQVRIVCEDDSELEINFNCDEDTKSRDCLTFRLHPPSPTNASTAQQEKKEEPVEIALPVADEPVEFVVRFRKYRGYLIVQYGKDNFSIYDQSGTCCGHPTSDAEADAIIDGYVDNLEQPKMSRPRP